MHLPAFQDPLPWAVAIAGVVASHWQVAVTPRREHGGMTKWQYKVERFDLMHNNSYSILENVLNARGEEGWELLGVHMLPSGGEAPDLPFAILKRS